MKEETRRGGMLRLRLIAAGAALSAGTALATVFAPMADTYLESDGTQAIDTGWKAGPTTKVVVDFEPSNTNNTRYVFGSVAGAYAFSMGVYLQAGHNISFGLGDGTASSENTTVYKNFGTAAPPTKSRYVATIDASTGVATLDGAGKTVTVDASSQVRTATADYTLGVFARHTADGWDGLFAGKIYSMQIYDGETLVRDFIPFSHGTHIGLYDRVNGVLHANVREGGNAFGFGTDDAYARGSSAQPVYIDTGFTPDCNTKVEFDFALCSTNSGPRPFGVIATSGLCWGVYVTTAGEIAYTVRNGNNNGVSTKVAADGRRRILTLDGPNNSAVLKTPNGTIHFEGNLSQMPSANESAAKSLVIFGGNAASSFSNAADVKVYGMKIWNGGTLARDFSPRIVDGVAGLWDAVDEKFYTPETGLRLPVGGSVECASANGVGEAANLDAYLEASAAGPILDTGYRFSKKSKVVLDYAYVATNNVAASFALDARSGNSAPSLGIYKQDGVQKLRYWNGTANHFLNSQKTLGYSRQRFEVDLNDNSATLVQDGATAATLSPSFPADYDAGASLVLFGRRTDNGNSVQDPQPLRVHSLKIYETEEEGKEPGLVRSYAPAVRGGVAGLYDPMSDTFAANVNSAAATAFSVHGGGADGAGLVFTTHPKSGVVPLRGALTLTAYAPGATGYQWLRDGEIVEDATERTLTVEWAAKPVQSVYRCIALYAVRGYAVSDEALVENRKPGMTIIIRREAGRRGMSYCEGKVAVVTGTGGTLCSAIAKDLARQGAKVVLVGRTREKLEKIAAEIAGGSSFRSTEVSVRVEPADVTDEAAVRDLAVRVASEWGPCRFFVNGAGGNDIRAMPTRLRFSAADLVGRVAPNAPPPDRAGRAVCPQTAASGGRTSPAAAARGDARPPAPPDGALGATRPTSADSARPLADATPPVPPALPPDRGFFDIDMAAFRRVLVTNTLGTVISSREFALQMARAGGGAILNFASMNTYRPLTRVAPYAMSKAAIANWTMFFAQYMAPAKVRVNAVAPGFMVNERSRAYLMTPDGGLSPRGEQVMHHTPAGRFGVAEDLLGCVNWLLDDAQSAFVTGVTVPVDGGFLASAGV